MRFMICRLEAPLMAFCSVAIDETRPTDTHPGYSMITGILANALGLCYHDTPALQRLQDRLVMGSRLDSFGQTLVDYQNAHVEKSDRLWRASGLGPAKRAGGEYNNVQRYRHFRADCRVTVALCLQPAEESPTLNTLADVLQTPARPLFLGRMSCPPSEPLFRGEWIDTESVRQALELAGGFDGLTGADKTRCEAEWPAQSNELANGWLRAAHSLHERRDLRNWTSDVHAGSRMVVRGMLNTAPENNERGGSQ